MILNVMCQPMTGRSWEHATSPKLRVTFFKKCVRLLVEHLPSPLPLHLSAVSHSVRSVTNVTCDNVVTRRVTTFLRAPVTMAIDGARDDEKCGYQVVSTPPP